ncbi:MAG: hypothetical protein IJO48_03515, partial [Clostridia bacterium]|nr:hypothetical protein [Clostridia bacterium]
MKKALAFFLVTIIIVSLMPSTIANTADYSMVGVILSQNADTFSIKADGTYFLKENSSSFTDGTLTVTRSSSSLLTVTHSEKGILYTGKSVSIMRENIDTDAGSLALGNFKYLGHFLISIVDGSVQIINHVPLSHYLYGVVKSAMSNSFPTEALKAQAIACKCLAINNFTLSNGIYTISDRASDLIYNGFDKNAKNIIKAVDATMNKALFANSAILDTRFCTSNGGETSLPSAQSEYYAIATDKYDFANPNSRIEKVSFSLGKSIDLPSSLHDTLIERVCAQLGEKADKIEEIYSVTPHSPSVKGASIGMTRCRFLLCVKNSENGTLYDNVACDIAFSALGCFRSPYLEAYWGEISQDSCTLFLARQGGGVGLSMRYLSNIVGIQR